MSGSSLPCLGEQSYGFSLRDLRGSVRSILEWLDLKTYQITIVSRKQTFSGTYGNKVSGLGSFDFYSASRSRSRFGSGTATVSGYLIKKRYDTSKQLANLAAVSRSGRLGVVRNPLAGTAYLDNIVSLSWTAAAVNVNLAVPNSLQPFVIHQRVVFASGGKTVPVLVSLDS